MKLELIPQEELEGAFLKLMEDYSHYYWAVAWAGISSQCFAKLKKNKKKIKQIVVGTHFYQTHPDFIKEFIKSEKVRFVSRTDDLFHPKIFLFENGPKKNWALFIGSANFTEAAFTRNTEAVVLIEPGDTSSNTLREQAKNLIEESWKSAERYDSKKLKGYRGFWKRYKSKLDVLGERYGTDLGQGKKPLHQSDIATMSWRDFCKKIKIKDEQLIIEDRLKALDKAAKYFQKCMHSNMHFKDLDEWERKAIAGTLKDKSELANTMAWFGSMKGAGFFCKAVRENNSKLSKALDAIPFYAQPVSKSDYRRFVDTFEQVEGSGIATGTRLLAMKRPDIFVCFDSANQRKLCNDFGISVSKMTFERYWDEIIARILSSEWWNEPKPVNKLEKRVWKYRSAFLDAIYYDEAK